MDAQLACPALFVLCVWAILAKRLMAARARRSLTAELASVAFAAVPVAVLLAGVAARVLHEVRSVPVRVEGALVSPAVMLVLSCWGVSCLGLLALRLRRAPADE